MSRRPFNKPKLSLDAFKSPPATPAKRLKPLEVFDAQVSFSSQNDAAMYLQAVERLPVKAGLDHLKSPDMKYTAQITSSTADHAPQDPTTPLLLEYTSSMESLKSVIQTVKAYGQKRVHIELFLKRGDEAALQSVQDFIARIHADVKPEQMTQVLITGLGNPTVTVQDLDKVNVADPRGDAWLSSMFELALIPQVFIKLDGLQEVIPADILFPALEQFCLAQGSFGNKGITIPNGGMWERTSKAVVTLLTGLIEAFGTQRLLYASAWSSAKQQERSRDLAALHRKYACEMDYTLLLSALIDIGLEGDALDAIFCKNAVSLYNL